MSDNKRWLKVASELTLDGKNGTFRKITFDNLNLKDFIDAVKAHGAEYLKGLSEDDIKAGQKLKYDDPNHIPRLEVMVFEKKDEDYEKGCPDVITSDLVMKLG